MEIGLCTQFSHSPAWELWQNQLTSLKGIVKGTICSSLPWTVPVYIYCPLVTTNGTLFYSLKYSSLDDNSSGHFKYSVHLSRVFPIFLIVAPQCFLMNLLPHTIQVVRGGQLPFWILRAMVIGSKLSMWPTPGQCRWTWRSCIETIKEEGLSFQGGCWAGRR